MQNGGLCLEPILLKEDNKPFYHGVFSKGGKKNKKRFDR